jgi:PAS domain S-box-containing protein
VGALDQRALTLEEQLAQREALAQLAMSASDMGAWTWDPETDHVEWSPELELVYGIAPGTFSGTFEEFARRIHPDDRERVLETIASARESLKELRFEHRVLLPDRSVRWIEARGRPLLRPDGRAPIWFGVGIDITPRRQAQEHLYGTATTLRLALDVGRMGLWRWSARDGLVVAESMRRLCGFAPDEEIDAPRLLAAIHPDDRTVLDEAIRDPNPRERRVQRTIRIIRPDGELVWVETRAVALEAPTAATTVWVGVSIDMTEQMRRAEELQEQQDRLAMLARIGLVLSGAGPLQQRLAAVLTELTRRFADGAALELVEGVAGEDAVQLAAPSAEAVAPSEPADTDDGRARLVVPVEQRGDRIGTLAVVRTDRPFRAASQSLVSELARRIALAVRVAQVHDREREVAEFLQRSLLPDRIVTLPGIDLAARYLAGTDLQVGGDFFDAIPVADGVLLTIGDVTGRGELAAVTMGRLRNALRAFVSDGTTAPAELLTKLDRFVQAEDFTMATMLCLHVQPQTGAVVGATAGHLPVLIVPPGGAPEWLELKTAPPLGVVEVPGYADTATVVASGSRLLLYTDGLVERRVEPLDHGLARLHGIVADIDETDPEVVVDRVIDALVGSTRSDDVAVLCARLHDPTTP